MSGIPIWAPHFCTERPAAMLANSNAWSSCIFLDRPTQKAPFKVSPAPVVSFTSTFMAGRVMIPFSFVLMLTPFYPRVMISLPG